MQRLIDAGADLDEQDRMGHTPLHVAAAESQTACVEMLLRQGADVNAACGPGQFEQTALHLAVSASSVACVQALLVGGASRSIPDQNGHDVLQLAVDEEARSAQRAEAEHRTGDYKVSVQGSVDLWKQSKEVLHLLRSRPHKSKH